MRKSQNVKMPLLLAFLATISVAFVASASSVIEKGTPSAPKNVCCSYSTSTDTNCIVAADVIAGSTIAIVATDGQSNADVRSWAADWGSIDPIGNYTAPLFQPPAGFDTVTYTTSGGAEYRTSFYVGLGSGQAWAPFPIQPPDSAPELEYSLPQFPPLNNTEEYEQFEEEYEVPDYFASDGDYDVTGYEEDGVTPIVTLNTVSYRELPTRALDQGVRLLVAGNAPIQKRKKCAVLSAPTWAGTNCAPGSKERVVAGKTKYSYKGTPVLASATVSGSVVGSGGSISVNYWKQVCVAYWYRDHYKCVDGKWKYIKTTKCTKVGSYAFGFDPGGNATGLALGYSVPGDPGYKFGVQTPNCDDY